jgi:hypothetical protein
MKPLLAVSGERKQGYGNANEEGALDYTNRLEVGQERRAEKPENRSDA